MDFFLEDRSKTHFICYVEITVTAKDIDFAKENADEKLHQLDNVLRFMSGNMDKNCGLGMFDFNTYLLGGYFSDTKPLFLACPTSSRCPTR